MFNLRERLQRKINPTALVERPNPEALYNAAQEAARSKGQDLAVFMQPALSRDIYRKIAEADPILAAGVKKYLPEMLDFCQTQIDLARLFTGLVLINEIKDVPHEALPFLGRGLFVAPAYIADDPQKVKALLEVTPSGHLPPGEIRDDFFRRNNGRGQMVTCPGILSACEALRILSENRTKSVALVLGQKAELQNL